MSWTNIKITLFTQTALNLHVFEKRQNDTFHAYFFFLLARVLRLPLESRDEARGLAHLTRVSLLRRSHRAGTFAYFIIIIVSRQGSFYPPRGIFQDLRK